MSSIANLATELGKRARGIERSPRNLIGTKSARRPAATGLKILTVLLVSLFGSILRPGTAQSAPPSQSALCSLFPPGFTDFQPGISYSQLNGGPAPLDSCMGEWTINDQLGYSTDLTIFSWNDVNSAQQAVDPNNLPFLHNASDEAQWHSTNAFGDSAIEQLSPRGIYVFAFRRGCYTAVTETAAMRVGLGNVDPGPVQNLALQIDQKLRSMPSCQGGQPPPPPNGVLGSAIACDTNRLQSEGTAVFTASAENQQPNATLVYEWTVDGQVQSAVTDNNMVLNNVAPGNHQVTVVVKDTTNGQTATSQSCTFTWDANGVSSSTGGTSVGTGPAGGASSGGGGNLFGPIVVGGAIASGIALVLLSIVVAAVRRSRRIRRPVPPPSGPINAWPTQRPPNLPETGPLGNIPPVFGLDGGPSNKPTTLPELPGMTATAIPDPSVDPPQFPRPTSLPEPVSELLGASLLSGLEPTLGSPAAYMTDALPPLDESQQSQDDQNKREASIRVYLEIAPSVQTARRNFADPHIWGDGVDLTVAGFRLEITPGWRVDDSQAQPVQFNYQVQSRWWPANQPSPTVPYNPGEGPGSDGYQIDGYYLYGADKFAAQFASQKNLWGPPGEPTGAMVISQPMWSQKSGSLQFHVKVTAALVNDQGESTTATDEDTRTIPVIGANPQLTLVADSDTGYSDGSDMVEITPELWLFDEIYGGGHWVVKERSPKDLGALSSGSFKPSVKILATGEEDTWQRLLEIIPDQYQVPLLGMPSSDGKSFSQTDPNAERYQQKVSLRCKFLLDQDPLIAKVGNQGVSIGFPVYVTGDGPGGEETDFDWMPSQHYKACRKHWVDLTPEQIKPAKLNLVPSTIQCASPDPKRLPHGQGQDRFTSRLSAVVYSGLGVPITGKDVVNQVSNDLVRVSIKNWGFRFYYDPPQEEWRTKAPYNDHGKPQSEGLFIACSGASQDSIPIDEDTGNLLFEGMSQLTYDHQKYFYRDIDNTGKNKYLYAQTCDLRAEFLAQVQPDPPQGLDNLYKMTYPAPEPIHIDEVDHEFYKLTITVKARSGEGLYPAQVTLTPASGAAPVTGETDLQGKVVINVPSLKNPYQAQAVYHTDREDNHNLFPWWKGGRRVELKGEIEFQSDEEFTIPVPVSTQWALQTNVSVGVSTPTPIVQGGTLFASAFLIDRSVMKTGDVDSDNVRYNLVGSPDPQKWRRVLLSSEGVTIGWSPPLPISIDWSFPGAALFQTKNPVCWADFACPGQIRQVGIDVGFGKASERAKFDSVVLSQPPDGWIDVSSAQMGVSGVGDQHVWGTWSILD